MQDFKFDFNKKSKSDSLGFAILALILGIGNLFFSPFVFMQMYNWFVVPATGWVKISYWLSFGIVLLLNAIKIKVSSKERDETSEELAAAALTQTILLLAFWGIAALVQLGV